MQIFRHLCVYLGTILDSSFIVLIPYRSCFGVSIMILTTTTEITEVKEKDRVYVINARSPNMNEWVAVKQATEMKQARPS